MKTLNYLLLLFSAALIAGCQSNQGPSRLEILFLGHSSEHHNSARYAPMLSQHVAKSGINITYTENPDDLSPSNLEKFDGLVVYANHDSITASQESALLDFVRSGKGFIPLHSASWCFRNSPEVVAMMGGQFKSHGWEDFTATIADSTHPTMAGIEEFETRDESYVHDKINEDIQVLMVRTEEDGREEPWTWVREEGKGRVFYTAFGHNDPTWTQTEFLDLVENGILWAVGEEARKRVESYTVAPLNYQDETIPNYEKRDPAPKFQLPLEVEESMSHIQVPAGFKLELFASEPMIKNPINMTWDHRGRAWVIETVDYPNEVRDEDGIGDDKIKILEDTDGDGKADKVTVFAENLNIPTSMVFVNGGLLVAQAPYFVFLKDTDGDDIADVRENVISGWGTRDTHAGPSNLRYGFDNKIWGTVGYSGFQGTIGNDELNFNQVVYNFNRDFSELDVIAHTTNNTWGLGFTENFDVFASTANNTHSAYVSVPTEVMRKVKGFGRDVASKLDGHYNMHPVTPNFRQVDVFGGFTAAAGHSFYTARNYPEEYWNKVAFVAEPTGHLLHKAIIEPYGAGFMETDGWNLMASSDEWVSPVQAEVGPDGNVWVLDWYNFIVQHNPTPEGFDNGKGNAHINPLRDKDHGRIYRVVQKDGGNDPIPELDPSDEASLLKALSHSNLLWRLHGQRLIIENQYTDLKGDLVELLKNSSEDKAGVNAGAIHAIWTLQGLGLMDDSEVLDAVKLALRNDNPGVRKAAIQALPNTDETSQGMITSGIFYDDNLNTRLAAFIKAIDLPSSLEIGETLYEQSRFDIVIQDAWLSKAIQGAALQHKNGFVTSFDANTNPVDPESLTLRIFNNYSTEIIPVVVGDYLADATKVAGKEISIGGRVWVANPDELTPHVLFAHGDSQNGYGVYREGNTWLLYIRQNGRTYSATNDMEDDNWFSFEFNFKKGGLATLSIDRDELVSVKTPGLFKSDLKQGLRVGTEPENLQKVNPDSKYLDFNQSLVNFVAEFALPADSEPVIPVDIELNLGVVPMRMEFDRDTLEVEAGKMVSITFSNRDFMQHNLLILEPGKLFAVGRASDEMVSDKDAAERNYVPDLPEVLFSTRLVNPNEDVRLTFQAPTEPGVYPFVCTFPGHWRTMNGVLIVK